MDVVVNLVRCRRVTVMRCLILVGLTDRGLIPDYRCKPGINLNVSRI